MVDIADFFGKKGSTESKKRRARAVPGTQKKKAEENVPETIVIDDEPTPKRAKTGLEPSMKKKINIPVKANPKKKTNDDFIDIDFSDDDDDSMMELTAKDSSSPVKKLKEVQETIPISCKRAPPINPVSLDDNDLVVVENKVTETEEIKTSTSLTKPSSSSKPKSKINGPATSESVRELLAKIPDAELPDVSNAEPFNFHAFKAKQTGSTGAGSGTFTMPEGAPNCLTGLTIVFTGILPNIPRDECDAIAKQYGAKVTKSISSKTSLVVLGEDAGPSKVKKIKQFKIKCITEEGFLQLIEGMPEEGGDGVLAQREKEKREEQEREAMREALKMQRDADLEDKKRAEQAKKMAAGDGKQGTSGPKVVNDEDKLWTVKYAPTKMEHICGNKGTVQKLRSWLETWHQKFSKPPAKGETDLRAVLIHGPPGIGKTTAAHLVAKDLGFDIIEKNASDVRSKKLLTTTIKNVLDNTSVIGHFQHKNDPTQNAKKFVIIMDEVDGMSGGDRGGVGELASYCRRTQTPLILICNDRSLPKMRPFDRVTLDLPFRRPSAREMKSRLMTIALREHVKLDPNVIDQLVAATGSDIRQIINLLSTVTKTTDTINATNSAQFAKEWQKHSTLKIFDVVPLLFSKRSHLQEPLHKLFEYYFTDHAFVPPMIFENYLATAPTPTPGTTKPLSHLELVANAAETMSLSDITDAKIHSSDQQWSLMPLHALLSTILPSSYVAGQLRGRVNFASWFGWNSKTGKYYRLLRELEYRVRLRTGAVETAEVRMLYVPVLIEKLLKPFFEQGEDEAIAEIMATLDFYYMSKADWDTLMEFSVAPKRPVDAIKKIPSKTKSKFTRVYNKADHPVAIFKPGMNEAQPKGKKKAADNDEEGTPEADEELEDVDDF